MVDIQFTDIPTTPSALRLFSIRIVVQNPERVRQLFNQIRVYRSIDSTDGTDGNWAELTASGSRINLIGTSRNYSFVDGEGNGSYWYRITYYNSRTDRESPPSRGQQGTPSPALSVLSVEELKTNFLFGVDLTDDENTPYPDSLFQFYIESAVQWVSNELDIVLPATIFTNERHDFIRQDYHKFMWMHLLRVPVISVEAVEMYLPGNSNPAIIFPADSIYVDRAAGHVEVVPGNSQLVLGTSSMFLPMLKGVHDYLPQAFRVDYTAGFLTIPGDIRELVGMMAALGPLNIAGDLVAGAGIASQSISMDGISQSLATTNSSTNAGYGARLLMYLKQVKMMLPAMKARYRPFRMAVV